MCIWSDCLVSVFVFKWVNMLMMFCVGRYDRCDEKKFSSVDEIGDEFCKVILDFILFSLF